MKIFVNGITLFRLICTLLLPIFKVKMNNILFIINIIFIFFTDSIDGILARKYKVQTYFGALMDSVADKMLCIVLMLIIVNSKTELIYIIIFEILISIINLYSFSKGIKTNTSIIGKVKTWFVAIAIVYAYLDYFKIVYNEGLLVAFIVIAIFLQIITLLDYSYKLTSKDYISIEKDKKEILLNWKYYLFDTNYYIERIKK